MNMEQFMPEEFKSGNGVYVERATITRKRMEEIIRELMLQGFCFGMEGFANLLTIPSSKKDS